MRNDGGYGQPVNALPSLSLWTGAYTSPNGTGRGISALGVALDAADLNSARVNLAVAADSPSFLAEHPSLPLLYAVAEFDGTVQAFRRVGRNRP